MGFKRKSRQNTEKIIVKESEFKHQIEEETIIYPTKWLGMWSLLLSFFSVANPLFIQFTNSLQTQNMYAGFAMLKGDVAYGNFFGTSGVLFYLLTAVGSLFGVYLIFAILQFVAYYTSGQTFYRIVYHLTQNEAVATSMLSIFYLLLFAFGWGGFYASILAMPFALGGLWFLLEYFEDKTLDEGFIGYGLYGAFAFLIDPKSAIIWVVATLVLLVYNFNQKRFARGIYQILGTIFGFLIIVYIVGYYVFINEMLDEAIYQTFTYLPVGSASWQQIFIYIGVIFLGLGGLTGLIYTLIHLKQAWIKVILIVTVLIYMGLGLYGRDMQAFNFLGAVPYVLILSSLHVNGFLVGQAKEDWEKAEQPSLTGLKGHPIGSYLLGNLFLPLVVLVWLLSLPVQHFSQQQVLNQERDNISRYITRKTNEYDRIYAWDEDASLYLLSDRLAAAHIISPSAYLIQSQTNQDNLALDLRKNLARFIVVNQAVPLLADVATHLSEHYSVVESLSTEHFTVYQLHQ